jgi:hypothetical protein
LFHLTSQNKKPEINDKIKEVSKKAKIPVDEKEGIFKKLKEIPGKLKLKILKS